MTSKAGESRYVPTDEDQELFDQIQRLVRSQPERFAEAGQFLDERFSHKGAIRHLARKKRREHLLSKSIRNAIPLTRAGNRRHELPLDPEPLQRDDGGLKHPPDERFDRHCSPGRFANGARKPISTYKRFLDAVEAAVSGARLNVMVAHQRRQTAYRILLLTWLITDPDAGAFSPVLTREFQGAGWRLYDSEGDEKTGAQPMWIPPSWRGDERGFIEHFYDRYWWRLAVFRFRPQWIDWVRQAWREVERETASSTATATGTAAVPEFTPTSEDAIILSALANAPHTMSQADIEATSGYPRSTVKKRLQVMEANGLVDRPHGPRKGYRITGRGRNLTST